MAEKYSGYILFCTERQVGAVIVVFLMSASRVYVVCVCDTCAMVVMYYESGGTSTLLNIVCYLLTWYLGQVFWV